MCILGIIPAKYAAKKKAMCCTMIGEVLIVSLLCLSVMGIKEKAILEIVLHQGTENGEYAIETERLSGFFTSAGSIVSAEGNILQVSQPLGRAPVY